MFLPATNNGFWDDPLVGFLTIPPSLKFPLSYILLSSNSFSNFIRSFGYSKEGCSLLSLGDWSYMYLPEMRLNICLLFLYSSETMDFLLSSSLNTYSPNYLDSFKICPWALYLFLRAGLLFGLLDDPSMSIMLSLSCYFLLNYPSWFRIPYSPMLDFCRKCFLLLKIKSFSPWGKFARKFAFFLFFWAIGGRKPSLA